MLNKLMLKTNLAKCFIALLLGTIASEYAVAQVKIDGFTEPFKTIKLASDDSGILASLLVSEGSKVTEGQVLAKLDQRLQEIQLKLAEHQASANSNLDAAKQMLEKREQIFDEIQQLRYEGHASESEVIRAEMERSIARAKFFAAQEESISRQIDLERAQVQLARRFIKAPFDGVVAEVHRHQGEFISPVTPEIVTLIQSDNLLCVFNIPSAQVNEFKTGQKVPVEFANGEIVNGTVHLIGVQTNAQSSTVQLKIRLNNKQGNLRAGEQCMITLAKTGDQ